MRLKFDDCQSLLIWLYIEISELFSQTELPLYTERFSNNRVPVFTDAELFTCSVFAELMGCRTKKHGYRYLRTHFHSWFPRLPSYEVYSRKLNKYHEALGYIFMVLSRKHGRADQPFVMIDTEPIEVCQPQHSRHSKAAQPFVSKGYCAAKKKYYVGAKLQLVGQGRCRRLPFPIEYSVATASAHDLEIAKETLPHSLCESIDLYGDKAYAGQSFQLELFENKGINMITPIKREKGQTHLMLFQQASNSIHASIRQPIDTLFGWINDKTGIQNASKVRSMNGLFYHVAIKMLAALIALIVEF